MYPLFYQHVPYLVYRLKHRGCDKFFRLDLPQKYGVRLQCKCIGTESCNFVGKAQPRSVARWGLVRQGRVLLLLENVELAERMASPGVVVYTASYGNKDREMSPPRFVDGWSLSVQRRLLFLE